MFFEVRIYKSDGALKSKVSSAELVGKHWQKFEQIEGDIGLNISGTKPVPAWVTAKLDLEFLPNLKLNY
jgi:hypothetical protein